MKKSTIIWIIVIIVIAVLAFSIYKLTGQPITGYAEGCTDSDEGQNLPVKGTTSYENRDEEYVDFCVSTARLKEFYCDPIDKIKSQIHWCACVDGACVE